MKPRILIIDDDVAVTRQLFWTLSEDYEVLMAGDMATAVRRATIYEPEVVILDPHLPPSPDSTEAGLRLLSFVKGRFPRSKVFVLCRESSGDAQTDCPQLMADGVLSKPLDVERLRVTLSRAAPARSLAAA